MTKAYLLLGGNSGDRFYYLEKAVCLIDGEIGEVINKSSVYESEPWGFKHKNYFLNQVLLVETMLSPEELLFKINKIENKLGRIRKGDQYLERTIDIDILFFDNHIIENKKLKIPHRHLHKRMFALTPLGEIDPELGHPLLNKTIKELKRDCKDSLKVTKVENLLASVKNGH